MSASATAQVLLKDFDLLPLDRQRMVLEFVHFLAGAATPPGTPGKNLLRFAGVLDEQEARAMSEAIAREYGLVKQRLRQKGRPIPENDIWIGATARQHSLTLVSRDVHFSEIEGLAIEAW